MKLYSRIRLLLLSGVIAIVGLVAIVTFSSGSVYAASSVAAPASSELAIVAQQTTTRTITALGRIELVNTRPVVLAVGGIVEKLDVKVGQKVKSGDLLLALDTEVLEAAVIQSEIGLELAKINLQAVTETVDASAIEVAEADLLVATERLRLVEAGPSKEELEAAKSSAAAAWSTYNTLRAGPTQAELDQSGASLKLAQLDVEQAQRVFNEIKWRPDAGMTSEGAALQRATISYEAAKASYQLLSQGAKPAEIQNALAGAQSAQNALNQLEKQPTPSDLAAAKAAVTAAQAAVTRLKTGSKAGQIRSAELAVQQAQIALDEAKRNLSRARVTAPIAGVLLEVNARVGDAVNAGSVAFAIIDTADLQATINVEQGDLQLIKPGQKAEVAIYGFGDKVFAATVERVMPLGQSSTGPITFPVVLRFSDTAIDGLLPGMTATATFVVGQ